MSNKEFQFSNDQRHAESLRLLEEVRDYISRWPPHPMNREMIKKIDAHLEEPTHRLVQQKKFKQVFWASHPSGKSIARATLVNDELTVQLPSGEEGLPDSDLLSILRKGRKIERVR